MEGTPKSAKRKMKQESPTVLFHNFADTADVSYDFLPKTKVRGVSSADCQIPLGQRPKKFIKSPNLHVRNPRLMRREKKQVDQQAICQRIFKNILDKSERENNEKASDSDDSLPVMKDACEDGPLTTLFDDSSNDLMVELSQQVEKDEVIESQNIDKGGVNCDVSCQLPVPDHKVKDRDLKNRHLLKHNQHFIRERTIKRDNLFGNKISKLSMNKVQKNSVQCERPQNVRNNTSHYTDEDFSKKQYKLLREKNKFTPDILDFVSLEFNQSHASLLLEDGNDAGFFEVDETTLNCSNISSAVSLSQKCTPQEIESKRREALKRLEEKKMKAKQVKH